MLDDYFNRLTTYLYGYQGIKYLVLNFENFQLQLYITELSFFIMFHVLNHKLCESFEEIISYKCIPIQIKRIYTL